MTWTAEKIETLTKLWKDGNSCGVIAERFGMTRNAVIGKVHRLGLNGRTYSSRDRKPVIRLPKAKHTRPKAKPPIHVPRSSRTGLIMSRPDITPLPLPAPVATDEARVALVDLESHHCRFVPHRPSDGFCGLNRVPGLPYCEDHVARCFHIVPGAKNDASHRLHRKAVLDANGHQVCRDEEQGTAERLDMADAV